MANTGFRFPSVSDSVGIAIPWANPDNMFLDDGNYASAITTAIQKWSTFGFFFFGFTEVNGIELKVEGKGAGGTTTVSATLSWDTGTTFTSAKTANFIDAVDTTQTYGGSTDNWGHTWLESELNDTNFRLRLQNGAAVGFSGDYAQVKIYYNNLVVGLKIPINNKITIPKDSKISTHVT